MNEHELRRALRGGADAEDENENENARRRSWQVIRAAYAGQRQRSRRRRLGGRISVAVLALLLSVGIGGGVALSAPHSAVGDLLRSVFGAGKRDARPALVRVPGGGRLLVQAGASSWSVSDDGAKRRLGAYSGSDWSPNGLFVAAWRGRELTALDPSGDVRWSLARPMPVRHVRWGPIDGFRIAYLSASRLRIVNGDGTADHDYGRARSDVAPAWRPDDRHVLAYADAGRVSVVAVDAGRTLWRSTRLAGLTRLAWSPDGHRLLAVTRRRVVLFDGAGRRRGSRAMPAGSVVQDAAWAPRGSDVAIIRRSAPQRSEVVLLDAADDLREQLLFGGPGRFDGLAWSPAGERLLVGWPDADHWLFLRTRKSGRLRAVANIAAQFSPGTVNPPFPRSVKWCCHTG